MKKKQLLAFSLAASLLLSGCSLKKTTEIKELSSSTNISFSWWGNDDRHIYTMDGVNVFQQENPEIDVSCHYGVWNGYERRNKVSMMSGTEADVMQINFAWLKTYSPDGEGYYDLNQLSDYIDLSNFTEDDLAFGTVNGKLNALPIAFNTLSIYYSQETYDKYNIPIPETWDDLLVAAEAMRDDGIYPLGAAKKQVFLLMVAYFEQTTGKSFFTEDEQLNITTDDMEYILEFYKKLFDEKALMPIDQWDRNTMTEGTCAGSVMWVSDTANYCPCFENGGFTPVIGEYLGTKDSTAKMSGWYMKPATMYAISANSEHPEEAAKLLDFLLNSSEMANLQQTEKGIPVSAAALKTLETSDLLSGHSQEANQKMLDERDSINVFLPIMENEAIIDAFKSNADSYLYDKESLEDTAKTIVKEMRKICNSQE